MLGEQNLSSQRIDYGVAEEHGPHMDLKEKKDGTGYFLTTRSKEMEHADLIEWRTEPGRGVAVVGSLGETVARFAALSLGDPSPCIPIAKHGIAHCLQI